MSDFPHLETERLLLREISEEDSDAILRIYGNAKHMQWFGTDPLTTMEEAEKVVAKFASWRKFAHPETRWGLELKERSGLVGSCGLFGWNRGWKKCTLGYEIAPEVCGNRLMSEALMKVIDWGFRNMNLNRIEAQVHRDNIPSVRLLQRLGFMHEGTLREVALWGEQHHDLEQYSLLASEWVKVRDAA